MTKKNVLKVLSVILVLGLLYLGRSLVFAAWVNNQPVFRLSLASELEKQGGKQVLENLIDQSLISQEAKKEKVTVSPDEVDQGIKNIEDIIKGQGLSLDEALKFRNQTRDDLKKQISLQRTIEKLLSSKITVTDAEITDYYTKNKNQYDKTAKFDSLKEQIKSQIFQQKLTDEYTKWIAELRAKAKIHYFVSF